MSDAPVAPEATPPSVADPFAAPPAADPFAPQPVLADEISAEPVADLPVVNAEGQVISTPPPGPEPVAPETAEVAPPIPDDEGGEALAQAPAAPPAPAVAPPASPPPPTTPVTTAPSDGSRPTGPRGGKGEVRYYKLMYLSAADTFTVFDLATVPDDIGVTVCKYAPQKEQEEIAAKRAKMEKATAEERAKLEAEVRSLESLHKELWFEARNNEHANRLGFAIMGRPKDGCQIFPVPRGAWKPKTVKPAPPAPARERVVIS